MRIKTTQSISNTVEFYANNLSKLIDLDIEWFVRRVSCVQQGNLKKAEQIEKEYLEPIQRKIKSLAQRAVQELTYE